MSKEYPQELISNPVEAYIVGLFWKHPDLYLDYDENRISKETFTQKIWWFYFLLGKQMRIKENKLVFDDIAVETTLAKFSDKWRDKYEDYGGFQVIQELIEEVNKDNFDSYYDELKKLETLRRLYDKDFAVIKNIDTFQKMTHQQIMDYWDLQLNEIFLNADVGVKVFDLCENIEEHIQQADKKPSVGLPLYNMPILNSQFQGLGLGCVYELGLHSGRGKTRFICSAILMSALEHNEKVTILANEQGLRDYRNIFISTVLKNKFNYNFNGQRWLQGNFNSEEKKMLKQVTEYLEDTNKKNLISFIPLPKQDYGLIKKIVKKQALLGNSYICLDTFKSEAGQDQSWEKFMDAAMEIDEISRPTENGGMNVNTFMTLQLSKTTLGTRYLTESAVGISKNVMDIATVQLLGRKIREDERTYGKYPLEVWNYDSQGNKYEIKLDDTKTYYIFWVTKNRRGITDFCQFVMQVDLSCNYWKEIGITKIPQID